MSYSVKVSDGKGGIKTETRTRADRGRGASSATASTQKGLV